MNALDESLREAYSRDGVTCLRGLLNSDWVTRMRRAIAGVERNPGPFRESYSPNDAGTFLSEKFLWTMQPDFRSFVFESPVAAAAADLMDSRKVNIFYDHLMLKEPGAASRTPWHQDLNYWPVEGVQVCSVWTAFDAVDADNGKLEFVAGSHLWPHRFQPFDFRGTAPVETDELEPLPDIDARRDEYPILSWDLEPGDALVFSALTLHGARGNTSTARRRRALSTRWAGDDARYVERKRMIKLIRDPGLRPGEPLDSELFPVVWPPE